MTDPDPGASRPASPVTDLRALLGAAGDGVHWTLVGAGDLNANLVRLEPGHEIGHHLNGEVDVLVVVLAGDGRVEIDGRWHDLTRGSVALVPRGTARRIVAEGRGLDYLTVHRRRGRLGLGPSGGTGT